MVKSLFYKAKEEGKDFYKCLMIYHNTPLTGSLQSPMQILHGRKARSDLPMSNATRTQLGIQPEVVRNIDKHAALPTHDLHVGQQVMYQDSAYNHWYPTVIDTLCHKRWYYLQENTISSEAFYTSEQKLTSLQCVSPPLAQSTHRWPVKTEHKKKSQGNNQRQVQTRRYKRDTKPPVKFDI